MAELTTLVAVARTVYNLASWFMTAGPEDQPTATELKMKVLELDTNIKMWEELLATINLQGIQLPAAITSMLPNATRVFEDVKQRLEKQKMDKEAALDNSSCCPCCISLCAPQDDLAAHVRDVQSIISFIDTIASRINDVIKVSNLEQETTKKAPILKIARDDNEKPREAHTGTWK